MNCDDYLSMLETLPVEELAYGQTRAHAAQCRDCDRVTRVVAERERNMLAAFGDVHSSMTASEIAAIALETSRRRSMARYYRIGLGILTVVIVAWLMKSRLVFAPNPVTAIAESFRLQCLSPEQAAELLRPYIQSTGKIWIRPNSPLGIVNVEGSREQMLTVRLVLDRYDSPAQSQCGVKLTVPKVP